MAVLAVTGLLGVSCTQTALGPVANASPAATTPTSLASGPAPSAARCTPSTAAFGLLIAGGSLQVIDTCAGVKASAPITASSVHGCFQLAPPVSATNDRIYYRDDDTKIKFLTLDGQTADATTVPGSATTVSFFSVSPDDTRIAVVVEDVSATTTIGLRLYVEDVQGGGHHSDIYSATVAKDGGTTLWPMGWHSDELVLAVMQACAATVEEPAPTEWHVVSAATADRLATLPPHNGTVFGGTCFLGRWPSPAGGICVSASGVTTYDWAAKQTGVYMDPPIGGYNLAALSPSGQIYLESSDTATRVGGNDIGSWFAAKHGCMFIDEHHVLGPDSVIELPGNVPPSTFPDNTVVRPLAAPGTCAGRFPGGL